MIVRGTATCADLGSSSNYSGEKYSSLKERFIPTFKGAFVLEGRSGEGFLLNGNQRRVSRA